MRISDWSSDVCSSDLAQAESLSPRQAPAAFLTRQIFAEPVSEAEDLGRAVTLLLEHLCCELVRAGRGARQLELTAYRTDGSLQRLTLGTSRPSRDARHLRRLFTEKLPRLDPGFGVEVMTLGATLTATDRKRTRLNSSQQCANR